MTCSVNVALSTTCITQIQALQAQKGVSEANQLLGLSC